ncbi:MAG TPA: cyclopropane-fatty-acyl-phospholipid synthase family protein [bacterium]|jgi:cyclopropane-fatty-acyl-phospholipid synthase
MGVTTKTIRPQLSEAAASRTVALLDRLFGGDRDFTVRLWNGTVLPPATGPSQFTLVLNHPGALRQMLLPPSDLALGEAYVRGDFDVDGSLEAATASGVRMVSRPRSWGEIARVAMELLSLPNVKASGDVPPRARVQGLLHTPARDRLAVRHHYDVGNDFYELWLDRRMVYSCAYFPTGTEDIDTAQTAKLEHTCRKLRLQPGERLLDIGCGWGGLVMYAAERFGVQAVGITLSEPQAALARERIAAAGLSASCRVEVVDYREFSAEPFDKIVSVGMFEHVGRAKLPEYFAHASTLLRPGGLFLNHGIVGYAVRTPWRRIGGKSFIDAHIFPDGELLPLAYTLDVAERTGFEVRDVESLREHYARTLHHWLQRLERRQDDAVRLVGEGKYRTWRLYLAGSANGFVTGRVSVFQSLLAKADAGQVALPWSRADLYQ